jgi:hypothetical protein
LSLNVSVSLFSICCGGKSFIKGDQMPLESQMWTTS